MSGNGQGSRIDSFHDCEIYRSFKGFSACHFMCITESKHVFGLRQQGTGNSGKPGKKLRLEDLQGQFGVGLKEAASRLGICATTLKRACRCGGFATISPARAPLCERISLLVSGMFLHWSARQLVYVQLHFRMAMVGSRAVERAPAANAMP